MVLVSIDPGEKATRTAAEIVTLTNGSGAIVAARLIGPVSGEAPEGDRWRIAERYRVDPAGVPLSSIAVAIAPDGPGSDIEGHDWGALGLPHGLETRVRPAEEAAGPEELVIARASSGHRHFEETPLLRLSPGDRVRNGGMEGTVIAVDRRKRTVEIDAGDETRVVPFDDVQIEEPS